MPAVDVVDSVPVAPSKEGAKSVAALEELIKTLSVSKSQDETSAAANNIASLLNGPAEEQILPSK
jgi:elongation factor 3